MRILKQLLFAIAVMICFSVTASAQKQDDKKPKETPKIVVAPKDDKNKPKGNEKPKGDEKKKPNSAYLKFTNKDTIIFV